MIILTIRTDKPEAEIGFFDDQQKVAYETWQAHYELSRTIHQKIEALLTSQNKTWQLVEGIVAFQGPGSFTGLRIGLTVAAALAYGLNIPMVGQVGDDWIQNGVNRLAKGEQDHAIVLEYGAPVHITQAKK